MIKKAISVNKANEWFNAIISKAIDIGEIYTHYFAYEGAFNKTKVSSVTYYEVSNNLTFKAYDSFIDVIYYNDNTKAYVHWVYELTA